MGLWFLLKLPEILSLETYFIFFYTGFMQHTVAQWFLLRVPGEFKGDLLWEEKPAKEILPSLLKVR